MRLLTIDDRDKISATRNYPDDEIPPYAILSHTWGADEEEVTLSDLQDGRGRHKTGYHKLVFCGRQARRDGIQYFWVDTCAIDKINSTELSESLVSMFRWYQRAAKCYAYLSDVSSSQSWQGELRSSRWFTRGWTLQELLAPPDVEFFSREGNRLGDKQSLQRIVHEVTGIPSTAILGTKPLSSFDFKERMRWAQNRQTKKTEDRAYSMLGILGIFMPPMYGEGENAYRRLEDEVSKSYREELNFVSALQQPCSVVEAPVSPEVSLQQRKETIIASLRFQQIDSRFLSIKNADLSTCSWFLSHRDYTSWRRSSSGGDASPFLWINGKPGAGKSTLMKFALEHVQRSHRADELVVSFFFNARGEQLEKSVLGMYRSLLMQLLVLIDDSLVSGLDKIVAHFERRPPLMSTEQLSNHFAFIIDQLRERRIVCFIDALDECEEEDVHELVDSLEVLLEASPRRKQKLRIYFASRHYPTIQIRTGNKLILELQSGHKQDLDRYIRRNLNAGEGQYIQEIRQKVLEKANGVFMWTVLVVQILNREFHLGKLWTIKQRLDDFPSKLSELFRELLHRDGSNLEDLKLCLLWILFSRRPLNRKEFYFAMMAGLDPAIIDPSHPLANDWHPGQISTDAMDRYLLNSSKGLAELTQSTGSTRIQFIHESVRDYLLKDNGLSDLFPEVNGSIEVWAHEQLKLCCMKQLDAALLRASRRTEQEGSGIMPFLKYATRSVLWHANESAAQTSQARFLANLPLGEYIDISNSMQSRSTLHYSPSASLQYLLAEDNLGRLISTLRETGVTCRAREQERYSFPILAAAVNGATAAFAAIFDCAEAVSLGKVDSNIKCLPDQTPLECAIETGHDDLALAILTCDRELDLHAKTREGEDVDILLLAAVHQCTRTIDRLLDLSEWSSGAYDECLRYSCHHGHLGLVDKLVKKADVNCIGPEGQTPVMMAAANDHHRVVELLLEKGASSQAVDESGRSALHHFAANTSADCRIGDILLQHGASATAKDKQGCTPLHMAADRCIEKKMDFFITSGCNVNSRDDRGFTPLHHFCSSSHLIQGAFDPRSYYDIDHELNGLELLLEYKADVNALDNDGYSVLNQLCQTPFAFRRQVVLLQLLLDRGASFEPANQTRSSDFNTVSRMARGGALDMLLGDDYTLDASSTAGDEVDDFIRTGRDQDSMDTHQRPRYPLRSQSKTLG